MITAITCSMLESQSTSDYNKMNTCVSKSSRLDPAIKHPLKERRFCCRVSLNLVRRGGNIREQISLMKIFHWKKWEVSQDIIT